ncbi:MAG: ATP-binding cassette domain-containing protein [Streptosporangiales bacterium]
MTPIISATALGRRYRDQAALDDVSLTVGPGTVTGLLGRNGAGKTTLLRIVAGQEFPTGGAIAVFGEAPAENDAVLVYRRWNVVGLVTFIAVQVLVVLVVVVAASITHNWAAVGDFFTTLTAPALTGVLAAVAVALGLGGLTTIRRVTI